MNETGLILKQQVPLIAAPPRYVGKMTHPQSSTQGEHNTDLKQDINENMRTQRRDIV